jgi:hypothetical protein
MKFPLTALIALLIATVAMPAVANEVWRTVDDRGQVVYSDRPLSTRSELVKVDAAQAPATVAEAREPRARDTAPQPAARGAEDAALAAARAEQAEIRARACREAREAAAAYESAPRLYQELPNGGRRYLSDEELVQARLEARRAIADLCAD